jgi:hypothetical protein
MIDLVVDALELQEFFGEMDWEFCFIGGLALKRSRYRNYTLEILLRTFSAEALIIFKAIASRAQDWIDFETIVIKQNDLDRVQIEINVTGFAEILDSNHRPDSLRELRERFYQK